MSQEQERPVVVRLADLENRLGELNSQAGTGGKGWVGRFGKGQVVAGSLTGMFSVVTALFGLWAYLVRAPHVVLSFHHNIEARWNTEGRQLSFECYLVADNSDGTAADTLQAVRADLQTQTGATLRLGRIELKNDTASLSTPFFVVKERESLPLRVTLTSTLTPEMEQLVREVGLYRLVVHFKARGSRLEPPAQTYCFYLGKNAADYLLENGQLLPDPEESCDARIRLAGAQEAEAKTARR
jgi:hypothetical protein